MIVNPPKNYGNCIIYEHHSISHDTPNNLLYIGTCKFTEFSKFQNERNLPGFPGVSEFKIVGFCDNLPDAEAHARNLCALLKPQFLPMARDSVEKSKRIRCITTGREYERVKDASIVENVDYSGLHRHLSRLPGYKTIKGKIFERVQTEQPPTSTTPKSQITYSESKPLTINWHNNWCVVKYVIEGVTVSYSLKSLSNLSNFHDLTQIRELCIFYMTRQYDIHMQIVSQHVKYEEAKAVLDLCKKLHPPRYGNKPTVEKYPKYRCTQSGYEFMTTLEIAEFYGITINAINEHISRRAYKNGIMCDDGIKRVFEKII